MPSSKVKFLLAYTTQLLKAPQRIFWFPKRLYHVWKLGGFALVKKRLDKFVRGKSQKIKAWTEYRKLVNQIGFKNLSKRIESSENSPLISIIIPTYNTATSWLSDAIQSVLDQIYPKWELCIVDDGSTDDQVKMLLEVFASQDPRIKVRLEKENRGIAATSNIALEMAQGDYVLLMDHDDLLEEQALLRVAEAIVEDDPDIIYSDECLVSEDCDKVLNFAFRPGFSPEFLRSHPYIVHLVAYRTQLLKEIGGFNASLKISHDYDLLLRAVEKATCITHIPEALYLWRIHPCSAGHTLQEKVMDASKAILTKHLERQQQAGYVTDGEHFNFFNSRYTLSPDLKVAIIIPTKNCGAIARQCIESIQKTVQEVDYDIVLVDHASDEPESVEYFRSIAHQCKVLRYEGTFNFSTINNWAVAQLDKSYSHYLFCNNDIEAIEEGWLERMLELAQQPDIGIVGAKLLYPDLITIQHAGVGVGLRGAAEHYGKFMPNTAENDAPMLGHLGALIASREVSSVTAACLLMRRDAFEAINGFDQQFAVGFGDVDLCLRTHQVGYRVIFCPQATLVHHESLTRGKSIGFDPHPEDSALFLSRWKPIIESGDPYYNPNLCTFSTSWHPLQHLEVNVQVTRRVYRKGVHLTQNVSSAHV